VGFWDWLFPPRRDRGLCTQGPGPTSSTEDSSSCTTATLEAEAPIVPVRPTNDPRWWQPRENALIELCPPPRPELTGEATALENLLVDHFDGHDMSLPPMPSVPERVLRRMRDRRCNAAGLAEEIGQDQVVASAVLRAVNSPAFRGIEQITSLPLAVARLGANALRAIMMSQSLHALTFNTKGGNRAFAQSLWRRSVAEAHIMSLLAHRLSLDEDTAFLIGLLHDIGNTVVLRIVSDHERISRWKVDPQVFEYLCYQCHQEFGELVAEAWNLPEQLKAIVSEHHIYPDPEAPDRTERLCLELTDMISALLGYASSANYDLIGSRAAGDLGLSQRNDFPQFLDTLPRHLDEAIDSLE